MNKIQYCHFNKMIGPPMRTCVVYAKKLFNYLKCHVNYNVIQVKKKKNY